MTPISPFHLAIPVRDLAAAEAFYGSFLGCGAGRRAAEWIDFNFFGHQLSVHLKPGELVPSATNPVDGKQVPVRHFGVVLPWEEWQGLAQRLEKAGITFTIAPHIRFAGEAGEQATMFFADPSGNMLEFKSFRDPKRLFAR